MNYIGSKHSLLPFIEREVKKMAEPPGVFCDLFAGTGAVAARFKRLGWSVIANDIQRYSYVRLGHLLLNNSEPAFRGLEDQVPGLKAVSINLRGAAVCAYLNALPGRDGYVYKNFCVGGTKGGIERRYFSDENGRRCDSIRDTIADWNDAGRLTEGEHDYLLAALLEAIDAVANTASVYGAFLKKLKKSALKSLELKPLEIIPSSQKHQVFSADANELIREISGDVLYLDPPYNQRQYAANYHVLETIAQNDKPKLHGKTGLRDWSDQKSRWCSRSDVLEEFSDLIENAQFKFIALSYNDEGLLSVADVRRVMRERGDYRLAKKTYNRFRADKAHARNHKRDHTVEYLHCLRVEDQPAR